MTLINIFCSMLPDTKTQSILFLACFLAYLDGECIKKIRRFIPYGLG